MHIPSLWVSVEDSRRSNIVSGVPTASLSRSSAAADETWGTHFGGEFRVLHLPPTLCQQGGHLRHPVTDGDVLRAEAFAGVTVDAGLRALFFSEKDLVLEAGAGEVVIEVRVVEDLKIAGNVEPVRAGHAVVTPGAWNRCARLVLLPHVGDQFLLGQPERVHARPAGEEQVLFHLLHGTHAAEND